MTKQNLREAYPDCLDAVFDCEVWNEEAWSVLREEAANVDEVVQLFKLHYQRITPEVAPLNLALIRSQLDSLDFRRYIGAKLGLM